MTRRAAIYARVSTQDQDPTHQLTVLREVAARRGWAVNEYVETVSGAARNRPQFDAMMADVRRRKVDVVAAVDLSRLARSVTVLMGLLDKLRQTGCDLYVDREALDTTTAAGRMMFAVVAAVAAFERDILIERTKAGLATARAKGVRLGRPPTGDGTVAAIRALRAQGIGMNKIAAMVRCSKRVSQRVCTEYDREVGE